MGFQQVGVHTAQRSGHTWNVTAKHQNQAHQSATRMNSPEEYGYYKLPFNALQRKKSANTHCGL